MENNNNKPKRKYNKSKEIVPPADLEVTSIPPTKKPKRKNVKTHTTQEYLRWLGHTTKNKYIGADMETRREELGHLLNLLHDLISIEDFKKLPTARMMLIEIDKYKQSNFSFKDQIRMCLIRRCFGMIVCLTKTIWEGDTWGPMNNAFAREFIPRNSKKVTYKDLRVITNALKRHLQFCDYDRDTFQLELHKILVDVINDKNVAKKWKIHAIFRKRAADWLRTIVQPSKDAAEYGIKVYSLESVQEHLDFIWEKYVNDHRQDLHTINNSFRQIAPKMGFYLFWIVLEETLKEAGKTEEDFKLIEDWIADGGIANEKNEYDLPTELLVITREVLSDFLGTSGFDLC